MQVGDIYEYSGKPRAAQPIGEPQYTLYFYHGEKFRVLKVLTTVAHFEIYDPKSEKQDLRTFSFSIDFIRNEMNKEGARKVGEVPDGGISPDDPRLEWLWDDAHKLAYRLGLCSDYDRIVKALGVPNPKKPFKVSKIVAGFTVQRTYETRTKEEAEKMFDDDFSLMSYDDKAFMKLTETEG